jgi:uncharacterized membrane-anchored protein
MSTVPADHPQRQSLNDEVHARPPEALVAPVRLSYLVLFSGADRSREFVSLAEIAKRFGALPPAPEQNHYSADMGAFRLKWERHTEFVRYTFIVRGVETQPFAQPAINAVPDDWLATLPGETICAVHAVLLKRPKRVADHEAISNNMFNGNTLIGSMITGGGATAYTDFRMHEGGFGRLLVHDHGMSPRQAGRVIQRLLEIDTYRLVSLMALPAARAVSPHLTRSETDLSSVVSQLTDAREEDEPQLLDRLTKLEAEMEKRHSETMFRFSASSAYYDLVGSRIDELREERIEGLQTIREFNDRRLAPALATVRSVSNRQLALSERVARATMLLSTRVSVTRERQNQSVLQSMDRRANLQLRLQQTVEGLSIAAITYYVIGLVSYLAKALKSAGFVLNPDVVTGFAIPLVAFLVWYGLRRFRKSLGPIDK